MENKLTIILFATVSMMVMATCSPMSKSSYLEKYNDFVVDVTEILNELNVKMDELQK